MDRGPLKENPQSSPLYRERKTEEMGLLQETGRMVPETLTEREALSERLVAALESFESAQRAYFPGIVPQLRGQFAPLLEPLANARKDLEAKPAPPDAEPARKALLEASALCLEALTMATEADGPEHSLINFRKAGRRIQPRAGNSPSPLPDRPCRQPVLPRTRSPQPGLRIPSRTPARVPKRASSMAASTKTPMREAAFRSSSPACAAHRRRCPSS